MSVLYNGNGEVISIAEEKTNGVDYSFTAKFTEPGTVAGKNAETYISTQRIPVSEGDSIRYSGRVKMDSVCHIYDINGKKVWSSAYQNAAGNDSGETVAPANAVYAMCQTMTEAHAEYEEHTKELYVSGSIDKAATEALKISDSRTGNVSIRCGRELNYTDGTPPKIELFLLEAPTTGRFYFSRDMTSKQYAFTFWGNTEDYSIGILQNGDIIAVRDAGSLPDGKDDAHRMNPFVFLASENWGIQHEVDFGDRLKPCGWLENCGFCVLPSGTALFTEYTRMTVATANTWKITGDPTNPDNWQIKQTWEVTTTDNVSGFKHCHSVMYDPYANVAYVSTGDDSTAAAIYYSVDDGETWTQIGETSEKYCRLLNMIFTADSVYWSTDTNTESIHFFFRTTRDENGVLDWDSIVDVVNIPYANGAATYGIAYIPELEAALLLERCDRTTREMPVRLVDLADGTLHTLAIIKSVENDLRYLGFRTRFSEWYPHGGLVRVGFDTRATSALNSAYNANALLGNKGYSADGMGNINNLAMRVYKINGKFGITFDTYFV